MEVKDAMTQGLVQQVSTHARTTWHVQCHAWNVKPPQKTSWTSIQIWNTGTNQHIMPVPLWAGKNYQNRCKRLEKEKRVYLLGTSTWPRPMIPHNACPWGNKYTTYKLHQASLPDYTPQTSFRHNSYWGVQSPYPTLTEVKGANLCWPQFDPGVFHAFSMPHVLGKTSPRKWSILPWEAQLCQPHEHIRTSSNL